MEVHHPHHLHHKKKWKEYILEFFMLFLAVSLGFLAENIREHQIEKQREVAYLKSVHEDLTVDFLSIDSVIRSNKARLENLDSFFAKINNGTVSKEDIYYYVRNLSLRSSFEPSQAGFDQIKSAGGLRMVRARAISTGIQEYERHLLSAAKLEEVRERTLEQVRFRMARLLDARNIYEMAAKQQLGIMRFPKPNHAYPLVLEDKEHLNELLSLLSIALNTNRYINAKLTELMQVGQKLDAALIHEYGSKISAD